MQISIAILVGKANLGVSYIKELIKSFKERVSSDNGIFEAEPCLVSELNSLKGIGLLDEASLVVTPNAYKEDVLYDIIPDTSLGDLSVVRATTATRVNGQGFIELVPYNVIRYSEDLNNPVWSKNNINQTVNSIIAPNGTLTADRLTGVGGLGFHFLSQQTAIISGSSYTISGYFKKGTNNFVQLLFNGFFGLNKFANFDLDNGTTGAIGAGTTATITSVGDGWFRCTITATSTASTANSSVWAAFLITNANSIAAEENALSTSFYLWGAQLVQGTEPKDYFQTTDRLNVPRIDYSNGSCPSILVEPQKTNLILRSEEFENASWTKLNVTITANNATSPSGVENADKVVATNALMDLRTTNTISITNGNTYTWSAYVKNAGFRYVRMSAWSSDEPVTIFDLDSITVSFESGPAHTSKIEDIGNGWRRVIITRTVSSTSAWMRINPTNSPINNGTVNGVDGIYLWGAQLEEGAYPTSYIPTIASTVTRNADVISKTGVSSLIGQTEGTLYAEINISKLTGIESRYILHISDGTSNNRIYIAFSGANANVLRARIFNAGVLEANIVSSTITTLGTYKVALAYKNNDIVFYINGVQIGTNTSATVPTCSRVNLGHNQNGLAQFNDGITSAIIFKTRLSNLQIEQLTTL